MNMIVAGVAAAFTAMRPVALVRPAAIGTRFSATIERPGFRPWLHCRIEATAAGLLAWTITAAP